MPKITYYLTKLNYVLVVVGLLVVIYLLFPVVQMDTSINKIHSLSPVTKNLAKNLTDVVNINVYLTQNLPSEVKPLAKNLKNILDTIALINTKKIIVKYIDPGTSDDRYQEALKAGVKPLQFSAVRSDKLEVLNGFFGLTISYGGKQEVLPVASDVGNMEYFLVSTLNKLTSNKQKTVLVAGGNGEWGQDEISIMQKYLSSEYKTIPVVLNSEKELNQDADTLLINGPKAKYNQNALDLIKKWLDKKKGLVVWLDNYAVNEMLQVGPVDSGLWDLLKSYGFSFNNGMVADPESGIANFSGKSGSYFLRYVFWPKIRPENVNKTNPAVSGLTSVTLPWAGSLKIEGDVEPLLKSSPESWLTETAQLNPASEEYKKGSENKSSQVLAAVYTKGPKIIVVADSDFNRNQFLYNNQQNLAFALNTIDYVSQNQDLMSIRSKTVYNSPLPETTQNQKNILKIVGSASSLLMLLFLVVVVYIIRLKSNEDWAKFLS